MHRDEAAARLARQASEALAEMLEHSGAHPSGPDRFDWSSDALDELARAVVTIGEIVERTTARALPTDDDPEEIVQATQELATAIVRRRNSLLAENAAVRLRRARIVPVRRAG
ncbi:hypothetical protein EV188_103190 [Actinomycetospora succinea]|uniref:Uncharacterized protein n=1 Tax=Actinomycetospora succinea TaxID=663603 RepID=A0A4R6VEA6_9PSEU|nr:hypothetical protein [Actinomycetospora succinea]TDQ60691.1 hypothetical protein EV188_103190 [Actinomycetospora succinea]